MKVAKEDVFIHTVAETAVVVNKHKQLFFGIVGAAVVLMTAAVSWHYYEKSVYDKWATKLYQAEIASDKTAAYDALLKENGPLSVKSYAAFLSANLAFENKKFDLAQIQYETAAKSSSALQKYLAKFALAVNYEAAANEQAALALYQDLSKDAANPFSDFAKLRLADLNILKGDAALGKSQLQELAKAKVADKQVSNIVKQAAISHLALVLLN